MGPMPPCVISSNGSILLLWMLRRKMKPLSCMTDWMLIMLAVPTVKKSRDMSQMRELTVYPYCHSPDFLSPLLHVFFLRPPASRICRLKFEWFASDANLRHCMMMAWFFFSFGLRSDNQSHIKKNYTFRHLLQLRDFISCHHHSIQKNTNEQSTNRDQRGGQSKVSLNPLPPSLQFWSMSSPPLLQFWSIESDQTLISWKYGGAQPGGTVKEVDTGRMFLLYLIVVS